MDLNDAINQQMSKASGLTVPVILRDALGREIEIQAPLDIPIVVVALGPIGGFVFERSTEAHPSLRPLYIQSVGRSNEPVASKPIIDV